MSVPSLLRPTLSRTPAKIPRNTVPASASGQTIPVQPQLTSWPGGEVRAGESPAKVDSLRNKPVSRMADTITVNCKAEVFTISFCADCRRVVPRAGQIKRIGKTPKSPEDSEPTAPSRGLSAVALAKAEGRERRRFVGHGPSQALGNTTFGKHR